MDFEEKIYQIVRRKADIRRRRFIRKYGPLSKMKMYPRTVYKERYENVSKNALDGANKRINCGGYALEIDGCFFPNGDSLSGYVSSILKQYKFVRLLGDSPLQDDEYLVFYRFIDYIENEGQNKGHHFIKVNDDGSVIEKFGSLPPQIFAGWNERYEDSPEVTFAVKKNHDSELDNELESDFNKLEIKKGLDFEGSVLTAILHKNNQFEYHGHNFNLKKSAENELYIVNEEGEIVANIHVDEDDIAVEIREGKEDYVENFSGPVKPIIENGKLVNFEEFKEEREQEDREI